MGFIKKGDVAPIIAGFAVVAGIVKGFFIDAGEFGELEIMIVGTALGYLFGSVQARRNGAT